MEISNIDHLISKFVPQKKIKQNENVFAPKNPFRMVLIGQTGGGKTNLISDMLIKYIKYDKLYIYSPSIEADDKYQFLINYNQYIEKQYAEQNDGEEIKIIEYSSNLKDIPNCQDLDPDDDIHSVMVFDDCINDKKAMEKIANYFIFSRKYSCSVILQSQDYFSVPKKIRNNITHLLIYSVKNNTELREIAKSVGMVGGGYEQFQKLLMECTAEPYSFLCIDYQTQHEFLRLRKKFDGIYLTNNEDRELFKKSIDMDKVD